MVLDGWHHVRQDGGAAGTGNGEQVRETAGHQAEIHAGPRLPGLSERQAVPAADVDAGKRPRHGVEAGREHEVVEPVILAVRRQPVRRDPDDSFLAQRHQLDIGAVVGGVIVVTEAEPLAADRMTGQQLLRGFGIVDDLPDLVPDERLRPHVRLFVDPEIDIRVEEADAALVPRPAQRLAAFFLRHRERRLPAGRHREPAERLPGGGPELRIARLYVPLFPGIQRPVVRWNDIGGGPLKHRDMGRLPGDFRDRLHRRGAGAYHADPPDGEIDRLVRPVPGVEYPALEIVEPLEIGPVRRRQAAGRHDAVAREERLAGVRRDPPAGGSLVIDRGDHAGVQPDVGPEVEPVGHVIGVAQNLRLRRVALGPFPFLRKVVVELVAIEHALDVAARAGIAVPVPGSSDARRRVDRPRGQPHAPQLVEHVEPGEPGADDQRVESGRVSHGKRPSSRSLSPPARVRRPPRRRRGTGRG